VRSVVPEQMVGPIARLAQCIHVGAPEEIRLHIHLLDIELAPLDLLVHPLMARIEASRVPAHRHQAGLPLQCRHLRGALEAIGQPDLHLDVACRPSGTRWFCAAVHGQTGLVAMCGHTRRFNPSHQWVHEKIERGEFNIHRWMCRRISSGAPT